MPANVTRPITRDVTWGPTEDRWGGESVTPLIDDINAILWLKPETANPGLNAISGVDEFDLTGAVTYGLGDGGQEVIIMENVETLIAKAGTYANTHLRELHNQSQFWVFGYHNPRGSAATLQMLLHTTTSTAAGFLVRTYGADGRLNIGIADGTSIISLSGPQDDQVHWDNTIGNAFVAQFNIADGWMETWTNGFTRRGLANYRKSISALTFPAPSSPIATTKPPEVGDNALDGDVMVATGTGILTDQQIERLMSYGKGLSWAAVSGTDVVSAKVNTWRATPSENSLTVVGCFDEAPTNLRLYADSSRTARGSLSASSGALALDAQGWDSYEFTGLTADTTYQIFAEFADGSQDRRRLRVKTLPAARDGLKLGFGSCWKMLTDEPVTTSFSLDAGAYLVFDYIHRAGLDAFVSGGDDGYYDNELVAEGGSGVPLTSAQFQSLHENLFNRPLWDYLWNKTPFFAGAFSDHEAYGNDVEGTAAVNLTEAQGHMAQRYGRTYPNAPTNLYYSWTTPGVTWITLDTRTELEVGVQMTSAAQRQDMEDDMVAAVARDDIIIFSLEKPWDAGDVTPGGQDWQQASYATELTDIFDRVVTAGAQDRTLCVFGDHHAGGVDIDGASQGGFDTGGIVAWPAILASRVGHDSSNIQDAFPDYFDAGNSHWFEVDLDDSATQFSFSYDNEGTGPFTVTETLTFGSGATATLDALRDDGATGRMQCTLVTGSKPSDPDTIAGATATADINGTTPWMVDLTVTPHEGITTKTPITRTIG